MQNEKKRVQDESYILVKEANKAVNKFPTENLPKAKQHLKSVTPIFQYLAYRATL